MQSLRNSIVALALLTTAAAASPGQGTTPVAPVPGDATFTIFVRGAESGREQVHMARSGSDWIISSTGRFGDLVINRFEVKYAADWQPIELRIEAMQGQHKLGIATSFAMTTAINEISRDGVTSAKTDQVSARTVVLPNSFFAGYEALAARLASVDAGAEVPVYVAPNAEVKLSVKSIVNDRLQTPSGILDTRKYEVVFQNIGGAVPATITIDSRSRFARLDMPAVALSVVRSDLAAVSVRSQTLRNPTDADVTIPANGFNIAGTLTTPPKPGRLRHPAVVLVAGSGPMDRDETVAGIPIFAQLAGALADRGFMVLRYDKRGIGQSGGRTEASTLNDYADDVIAAVRWLAKRDDVDSRRISVVGHSEGGAVAMLAAPRENKIRSVVLLGAPGSTGVELNLEQQRHLLDLMKVPDAERQSKIEMQKRIQSAVTSGVGWDGIPPELRRQADTPWYRSLLLFDPAREMSRVKQPILIVQGDLDSQVPPHHADKLAEMAKARKKAPPVDVVHIEGVNHLFVPAKTGEVSEYVELSEKAITSKLPDAIADWLAHGQTTR